MLPILVEQPAAVPLGAEKAAEATTDCTRLAQQNEQPQRLLADAITESQKKKEAGARAEEEFATTSLLHPLPSFPQPPSPQTQLWRQGLTDRAATD